MHLRLSDSQKDDYYAQYLQIIKEVNALKLGSEVSVAPKDQIAEEDWITPEEFRGACRKYGSDGSC